MMLRSALLYLLLAPLVAQTEVSPPAPVAAERLGEILDGEEPRSVAELLAMQTHVQALLHKVLPATVSLPGASGVLVKRDGAYYVLCAAHVTLTADKRVTFRLPDGEQGEGTSMGANHESDVSLIRVDTEREWPAVEIGESAALQRGQWVLMLGHPSGLKPGRAAPARLGRVLQVPERGYLVTDCTMQAGDSGGPLFDMDGRVVGINSRINGNLAMNMHAPVDALVAQWGELQQGVITEARRRGSRGSPRVDFGVPLQYGEGCPVFIDVAQSSAAAKAGLRTGDRLLEIDGEEVQSRSSVFAALRPRRAGEELSVVVARDGRGIELQLTLIAGAGR